VCVSFYLGWVARDRVTRVAELPQLPASYPQAPQPETQGINRDAGPLPGKADLPESYPQAFRQLLLEQAFDEAMMLFERVQAQDEAQAQSLRADVLAYLQSALEQQHQQRLMDLVDAYLSRYYDDIDVLMILAEYQRRQGYPEEAAQVVQYALTYAYQPGQQEKIAAFFQALVDKTDNLFVQRQQWVELLGFYQLLESIDLSQPRYRLRQAMVYMQLQDFSSARDLLSPLAEQGQWAEKASELLAMAEPQAEDISEQVAAIDSIPLFRHGNHYVIKARLNSASEVVLMIDTGASITSLSHSSFDALPRHSGFSNTGSRLFNTVNGVTRGAVYNADQFKLGDHVLNNVELAVLDFDQGPGIDGLLGMNVLQYFRFEIDQDQQVLHLQPR
jgi:clan AA aspartic protease (TIGR02281 family)